MLLTQDLIAHGPVIPVIVLREVAHAVPLAKALVAGGVKVLEVTLRTPQALACMREICDAVPEAIVGAGTIRQVADVEAALKAGCRFGVSPGYTSAIGRECQTQGLPLLPGVVTPSEVMQAQSDGFDFLKFFPATAAGGIPMLKALHGPFADLRFCPTGGITPQTAPDFLALPNVPVCGGSWLTPDDLIQQGQWTRITALAQAAQALRP